MSTRSLALLLVLVIAAMSITLGGCSNSNNERQRLVCEVANVNGGIGLVSAYLDIGKPTNPDDDVNPIDFVSVTFHARPYNSLITLPEDSPFSYFHITSYDVAWQPIAGDSESLDLLQTHGDFEGALCDLRVPVYNDATVSVLVADRRMKDMPWFYELYNAYNPTRESFTAACELTFYGHESGNENDVTIKAGLTVTFVGVVAGD